MEEKVIDRERTRTAEETAAESYLRRIEEWEECIWRRIERSRCTGEEERDSEWH